MIQIHFKTLSLQCKQSNEVIDLTSQVSFFHGKVGSGKSSMQG
jgi:predicted ATPase